MKTAAIRAVAVADVRKACSTIEDSGVVTFIEDAIAASRHRSGRPRELSVRALLVGLLLCAHQGSLHLADVRRLLNGLSVHSKKQLGIKRAGGVTRRQVEGVFTVVTETLESLGVQGLDRFCDLVLAAAQPEDSASRSIAIDATSIDSWGTRRRIDGAWTATDPDARWRKKDKANPWKRPVFGYDLTLGVAVPEIGGGGVALTAKAMRFRPALTRPVAMALEVATQAALLQGKLGDVLVDREYTKRLDGTDFLQPIRALGGEPVFDLMPNQIGSSGTLKGAVIIDGAPFSPATPSGLHVIEPPAVNATIQELTAYQESIERRARWAMDPHGRRRASGDQDYKCPAHSGKVRCPLVASSLELAMDRPTAMNRPSSPPVDSVCSSKYTRFDATELPLAQRELYGSRSWRDSYMRRNRVEGFFGVLKNEACENVKRGTIRVRGLFKTGVLVAMSVVSCNLRLIASFESKPATKPKRRRGRPRKIGIEVFNPLANGTVQANAPPALVS